MPKFNLGHLVDKREENCNIISSSKHIRHQSLTSEEEVELEYQALMQDGKEGKVGYAMAPPSKKIAEGLHMYVRVFPSCCLYILRKCWPLTMVLSFLS